MKIVLSIVVFAGALFLAAGTYAFRRPADSSPYAQVAVWAEDEDRGFMLPLP